MKLMKITVTGADDSTQIPDIIRFTALYPRIEFGILVTSPWSSKGLGRYPSFQWIERLAQYINEDNRDNFSMHLCGKYVKEFFTNPRFIDGISMFSGVFSRMQVNTHNCPATTDLAIVTQNIGNMLAEGIVPILQYDHTNKHTIDLILDNVPPMSVHVVQNDRSHGAGVLPYGGWKAPLEKTVTGYAGGLRPGNVEAQLIAMDSVIHPEQYVWIDAETHLRANDNFSLDLVEDFYKSAAHAPVVRNESELV